MDAFLNLEGGIHFVLDSAADEGKVQRVFCKLWRKWGRVLPACLPHNG